MDWTSKGFDAGGLDRQGLSRQSGLSVHRPLAALQVTICRKKLAKSTCNPLHYSIGSGYPLAYMCPFSPCRVLRFRYGYDEVKGRVERARWYDYGPMVSELLAG